MSWTQALRGLSTGGVGRLMVLSSVSVKLEPLCHCIF